MFMLLNTDSLYAQNLLYLALRLLTQLRTKHRDDFNTILGESKIPGGGDEDGGEPTASSQRRIATAELPVDTAGAGMQ
jgi:hypothetical protein